ncbi:hypothetical protein [Luteirhabdus pelagi]|uniref:hypothetical protein n=1 Tax=Luteirhabdus pelagi TaxID=2792783 RepID=UPI001F34BAA2|nr:hypothetical protein [Luteirhabdus pelagi]
MKIFKTIILIVLTLLITACSEDEENTQIEENPVADLILVEQIEANNHTIELYSEQDNFYVGYNEISLRVKDNTADDYFSNVSITWMPIMHMTSMSHSCPKSDIETTQNETVSKGFMIFQMPGNSEEYWELTLNYEIEGVAYEASKIVEVVQKPDGMKNCISFVAADDSRYVLAWVAPKVPEVKVNDFIVALYKMENMITFSKVEDYTIMIDPRMPGMGNHSSPNNEHLTFDSASEMYAGKLSLTMSGYWKINMKLLDAENSVLKGEDVTDTNPESSLYLEIEF